MLVLFLIKLKPMLKRVAKGGQTLTWSCAAFFFSCTEELSWQRWGSCWAKSGPSTHDQVKSKYKSQKEADKETGPGPRTGIVAETVSWLALGDRKDSAWELCDSHGVVTSGVTAPCCLHGRPLSLEASGSVCTSCAHWPWAGWPLASVTGGVPAAH